MTNQANSGNSFFRELKRRKVPRTCVLYVLACWGVLQVADIIFPAMGLDADLASRNALYLAVIGFPLTFTIAWFFQISPTGVVRTTAFVERRILKNIPPINDRRKSGVSNYFRKDKAPREYQWILCAETGPLAGLDFAISQPLVIGRALDCELTLLSQSVSRHHARLDPQGGKLSVEDLGSSNGTTVNGKTIDGVCELHHEDELRFHDMIFRVDQNFSGFGSELEAMSQTTVIEATSKRISAPTEKK